MKYNQPYGVVDAEAPYVNGNPATGTMGSIPPAASIEHPQREVVNFIKDTGLITPSAADLHQLAKAIQAGGVNYADDTGLPNQIIVALNPAPPTLRKGLHVYTIIKYNNYIKPGTATLKLNTHAAAPILHLDSTPLTVNEMKAGTLGLFVYDGNSWQWVSAPFVPDTSEVLQGPGTVFYVDDALGNDMNDGKSATPFRTIGRAVEAVMRFNLNGYSITIYVRPGTYQENVELYPLHGNGTVLMIGDEVTPGTTIIAPLNGYCVHWGHIFPTNGWYLRGFHLQSAIDGEYRGSGIYGGYGAISLQNMSFGPCSWGHLIVTAGCNITIGPPTTKWIITGGAEYHMYFGAASNLINHHPVCTISGNPLFSQCFAKALALAIMNVRFTTINGTDVVTSPVGTARGKRYEVDQNAIMQTGGMTINYLPGDVAGTTGTGGQYS